MARALGWRVYHTYNSFRSTEGFPDLILLRGERMIAAELKSETGKVSKKQQEWLDDFARVPYVEAYTWRPSDLDEIERVLK